MTHLRFACATPKGFCYQPVEKKKIKQKLGRLAVYIEKLEVDPSFPMAEAIRGIAAYRGGATNQYPVHLDSLAEENRKCKVGCGVY